MPRNDVLEETVGRRMTICTMDLKMAQKMESYFGEKFFFCCDGFWGGRSPGSIASN
jgi:hypothetical protein